MIKASFDLSLLSHAGRIYGSVTPLLQPLECFCLGNSVQPYGAGLTTLRWCRGHWARREAGGVWGKYQAKEVPGSGGRLLDYDSS